MGLTLLTKLHKLDCFMKQENALGNDQTAWLTQNLSKFRPKFVYIAEFFDRIFDIIIFFSFEKLSVGLYYKTFLLS